VIQVHAVDSSGKVVTNRALPRARFMVWCAQLPAGCVVAMEASAGAHNWARKLGALGLEPRIMAAQLVAPYRMQGAGGKNDANDAAAICEAASRPQMRFVAVKTPDQQGILCVHRLREGFKSDRTACINRIRGLLAEFGLVFSRSPKRLREALADVIEDASNDLVGLARMTIEQAYVHWRQLEEQIQWCDDRIAAHLKEDEQARQAMKVVGVGPLTASAVVATASDLKQFKNGAQFGAWIGLTPRQHSSGGKNKLGRITKHGDTYLRTLLIQGAKTAVLSAHKRDDPISQWVCRLRARSGWQVAAVALANKNARILWAILAKGTPYDARHVSVMPIGECSNSVAA